MPDPSQAAAALPRRKLLQCGAGLACASALVQLNGCAERVNPPLQVSIGALNGTQLRVELARVPELYSVGGSLILAADAVDNLGRQIKILVANTTAQGFRAYDAYCPHEGCEVAWVDGDNEVLCPCHLSKFAIDGTVTNPPALQDLDVYPVTVSTSSQTLVVDLTGAAGVFPPVVGSVLTFTSADLPALATIGGSVVGRAQGLAYPIIVLRISETQANAFDARCPHLACTVRGLGSSIACPCHGSLFSTDGVVENGPATKNLTSLPVTLTGETFTVTVA